MTTEHPCSRARPLVFQVFLTTIATLFSVFFVSVRGFLPWFSFWKAYPWTMIQINTKPSTSIFSSLLPNTSEATAKPSKHQTKQTKTLEKNTSQIKAIIRFSTIFSRPVPKVLEKSRALKDPALGSLVGLGWMVGWTPRFLPVSRNMCFTKVFAGFKKHV